jgi:hypothetical protein
VQAIPWVIAAVFVIGVGVALYYRTRDQVRYAAIGRFVHEDV